MSGVITEKNEMGEEFGMYEAKERWI